MKSRDQIEIKLEELTCLINNQELYFTEKWYMALSDMKVLEWVLENEE